MLQFVAVASCCSCCFRSMLLLLLNAVAGDVVAACFTVVSNVVYCWSVVW